MHEKYFGLGSLTCQKGFETQVADGDGPLSSRATVHAVQHEEDRSLFQVRTIAYAMRTRIDHDLHMREPIRCLGLGRFLMRTLKDIAWRIGIKKITLMYPNNAHSAHRFFRRMLYSRNHIQEIEDESTGHVTMRKVLHQEPVSRKVLHEQNASQRNGTTITNKSAPAQKKAKLSPVSHDRSIGDAMVHVSIKLSRVGPSNRARYDESPKTVRRRWIYSALNDVKRLFENETQALIDEGKWLNWCEVDLVSSKEDI